MIKRVLVGSCGGLTGSYLARQFRQKGIYVVGADASRENVTKFFLDDFVVLPKANADSFIDQLLTVLCDKNIDAYFPTHSSEIRKIAECEDELRNRWHGKFVVSPYATYQALDSKSGANASLRQIGIPVPKQFFEEGEIENFPIFMKQNVGSGSAKAQKIQTIGLYREYKKIDKEAQFFEYIDGKEYTVDCMFDENGKMMAYNQRHRMKSMGGAVIITQNDYRFDIEPYLRLIEQNFLIKGCVNFQYILRDNVPYFTDVNLRYPSGGLPLSVASGINVPQIMLDLWESRKPTNVISCGAPGKIMYRYFEEKFDG